MKRTLGGQRLGSGSKMEVETRNFERSTHDLSYIWRSTMSPGTLVPFMSQVGLPGDTFDIDLMIEMLTHPTIGPLFGSYKVQADIFMCPIRLYQGQLHNNKLGIGMNMSQIKLPLMQIVALSGGSLTPYPDDLDNSQINPSCLLKYLGISGVDWNIGYEQKEYNAIPFLAYWDIYKQYYANKQEEIGAAIHTPKFVSPALTGVTIHGVALPQYPTSTPITITPIDIIIVTASSAFAITDLPSYRINYNGGWVTMDQLPFTTWTQTSPTTIQGYYNGNGGVSTYWDAVNPADIALSEPLVATFPLENIDGMREYLLANVGSTTAVIVNNYNKTPYNWLMPPNPSTSPTDLTYLQSQEGLAIKTYQSDLFNNWLSTDWIDGTNGITEITAIDTSGGSFTIDTLNLSKKVYAMLNAIAVSGGSYQDWIDAVYTHESFTRVESPVYMGGLIKELIFQEVVSLSSSTPPTGDVTQPLGTLAGKGRLSPKHKGGQIYVKCDEPCYIMGIVSLTPRIDYSQGNTWDVHLKTMDDFHKPYLDEIGFQELIVEQMAWWTTTGNTTISAGKQPAWINYMTNVNKTYGNFAIKDNEMFMTLNRRYEYNAPTGLGPLTIKDLTTYIDPVKYNFIFADTKIDAQNFWAQIGCNITARRKMSAKIMPMA